MKRSFVHLSLMCGAALFLTSMVGCAGKGDVRQFDLHTKSAATSAPSASAEPVKIVIEPFEDRRANKTHIGVRSYLGGGVTHFDVSGGKPADAVGQMLVSRLQSQGWEGRAWNVSLGQSDSDTDADIVISGQVEEFSANAKSRWFSTRIETKDRLTIVTKNLIDKSTLTRHIEGARSKTVFWFDEDDVQQLLVETLNDGIDRFIGDTKITEKALRHVR